MPSVQGLTSSYRKDLEGLRGLAMLSVLFFHAFPYVFSSGFTGVDIFFVLSGYLVTGLLQRIGSPRLSDIVRFFRHRVLRLVPLLSVVLICNGLVGLLWYKADFYQAILLQSLAAATFSLNWVLAMTTGAYGDVNNANPLLHLWSLAIEMQFYTLWAIVFYCCAGVYRRVLMVLLSLCVASLLISSYLGSTDSVWAFYAFSARLWEFGAGALVAWLLSSPTLTLSTKRSQQLSTFAVMLLIVGVCFPLYAVILAVIATMCLLAAGPSAWFNRYVLAQPVLMGLGKISYAMYVWHWVLFAYAHHWYAQRSEVTPWWVYLYLGALCLVLALLSRFFIEKPIRRLRDTYGL